MRLRPRTKLRARVRRAEALVRPLNIGRVPSTVSSRMAIGPDVQTRLLFAFSASMEMTAWPESPRRRTL